MTKMTATQAIDAIKAMSGTNTADEVYTVLMSLTKAEIKEVYMAVTGDVNISMSWKKCDMASTAAGRISSKKADAAFQAMDVMEKVNYLSARTEQSLRAPLKECGLYELVVIAKELGISASEFKKYQEEFCLNAIYMGYALPLALCNVIRRSLYEARESAPQSETEKVSKRVAAEKAEKKEAAKTARLMRKYAGESDWIQRVYGEAMEYSKDYEIPGYEVTEQDKVEHFLFDSGEEFEASIDYARGLGLRPRGVRGYDWDIGDYASELIPRIAEIVARIGAKLSEEEAETKKEESAMRKTVEEKRADSALKKRVIKAHQEAVRDGRMGTAWLLLSLLRKGKISLGMSSSSAEAEEILTNLGCKVFYSESYSTARIYLRLDERYIKKYAEEETEVVQESSVTPATLLDVCAGVENYDCGKLTAEELAGILNDAPAETLREYILKVIVPEKARNNAA